MKRVVHAACPHDCPDACGVLITVEDGRAVKVQGDPAHPVTRGFLCAKVAKYLDRVYSPERVLYPMRRVRPKSPRHSNAAGEGARATKDFERITWDEALDEIARRLRQIADESGSEAILPYSYGGTISALNGGSMDRRFFHRLGASQLERTICSACGEEAIKSVYGIKLGTEPEQFRHSKSIIAWGANIHGNNVHLWPFIEEARREGAKLVVIDPYRTRTARCADWHLPINLGTDAALALGMMHVIIHENLYDADYVARYTLGFDQLRQRVQEYLPQRVAQWTGIAADDIVKLAREYATTRPAAIRLNYGVQRSERGGMSVRTVCMLPCLTGSWKELGGGLQLSLSGAFQLNKDGLQRPDLMYKSPLSLPARTINMVELGKALTELNDPPVKALFVYNSNPAAVAPNHNLVVRGLIRPDLFTVVHEQFFTDTTDYADIVLPATTFLEHKDLQAAYGHYYLQVSQQAIEPLGECRSNVETFRALAQRMGFEEECFRESVDAMIDGALQSPNPWMQGIDRQRLEREGNIRLNFENAWGGREPCSVQTGRSPASTRSAVGQSAVPTQKSFEPSPFLPFAKGNFATASGKAEFYNEELAKQGLDPVASFTPPQESRHSDRARRFPLELLARKSDNFLNSSFANLPVLQKMEDTDVLDLSAADAQARGIQDGAQVRVFNDRGEAFLRARVNGAVRPGTVSARLNWAKLSSRGASINVLTSERLTDMGGGATFYSALVEVEAFCGRERSGSPQPKS
ncbi:MAG TPA: molybdopterin-dependent oxidoreductase [Terriglobales bacterium]|nr:molybdopterin-dependent oxidoreductase [Terriglobales bacterium]